ncbi:profilin family protein, putative [Eimeria maxima]|uniref:Profilin n=1 Tax=Eimeria maxima TaxID=5804 RepID=U6MGG2_EIMMA|nr:profilin family protein, putative [Eimeria maxima]CDJ60740.1 profilin family protein, putative [Eimeria maxima]
MGEEAADTSAWDTSVKEWLVDTGRVCAGAVASLADEGRIFGCAIDNENESAWEKLIKNNYKIEMMKEDGEIELIDCYEHELLRHAIVDGKAPNGVYIGGIKYKLAEVKRDFTYNDQNYDIAILGKNKGGGFLIKTPNDNVVVALYDEEKEQNKADALTTALAFAEYLYQGGF